MNLTRKTSLPEELDLQLKNGFEVKKVSHRDCWWCFLSKCLCIFQNYSVPWLKQELPFLPKKAGVAPTSHFYFHHLSFSYLRQLLFWFLYAFFQSCCICSMLHLLPLCLLFFLPEDFTVSCSLFPAAFYQSTFFIVYLFCQILSVKVHVLFQCQKKGSYVHFQLCDSGMGGA